MYFKKTRGFVSIVLCIVILIPTLTACSKEVVTIQVPSMFFTGTEQDELIERSKALGISDVTIEKDNSVTFTMSEKAHKKLQDKAKAAVEHEIKTLTKDNGTLSYIKDIKVNDAVNEFTVMVDASSYPVGDNSSLASLYTSSIYCQIIGGKKAERAKVSVIVKDNSNDTVIETF